MNGETAPVLVTGGSGFIGSNLADSLLGDGHEVIILDNFSRPGVERNFEWLRSRHGERVHLHRADIRDAGVFDAVIGDISGAFHFAAQTAVTTSMTEPVEDFDTNLRGTLNLLEAIRRSGKSTPLVFASTNKVYGSLGDLAMMPTGDRHIPADREIREHGVCEARPLDFCTPYGCSKGAADQYVLDYADSFGIPTAVLRMSCIYGPRQFGTEDQGWVAHFLFRAMKGQPITVFGDGKQVRDVLHVADAVAAYRKVLVSIRRVQGCAFNLGGGPANAVSLRLVLREIALLLGRPVDVEYRSRRPGDQFFFVADTRRIKERLGWKPTVGWKAGLRDLADWLATARVKAASDEIERMSA
jgi:CDP-paratose 2-epimerase